MIPSELRPLGIGEVLDRAVTVFVRSFAALILILALVAVPLAIVQYATTPATENLIADIQRLLAVPPGHPAEQQAILRAISARNQTGAVSFVVLFGAVILGALSTTACIIAVAQAYSGKVPSVREVYREAFRRWLPQLVVLVAFAAFFFILAIAIGIVTFVVLLAVAAIGMASKPAGIAVGVPVAVIVGLAFVLALVSLYFTAQMSIVSLALEEPNPIRAIASGIRRTLSPKLFWRSALVATIVFGVSLAGSLVLVSIGALVSALTHLPALSPVVTVSGGVALNALLTAFIVVYAIDVRIRREGYDLELAVRRTALSNGGP